ncbi:MAG: polymer-forming cytoskeletal protein [Chloroflexia bacterium]|nr:polymer-forming cytoskeletal protein [Chloroflexia bacterium]
MVFRKESKVDAFQRQISALRQQLGSEDEAVETADDHGLYDPGAESGDAEPERYTTPSYRPDDSRGYSFSSALAGSDQTGYADSEASLPVVATPEVDGQTSVVAHDTTWNGDLQSSGSLHIHGVVDGSLTAREDVYIAEEADVTATITAANVIIAGLVRGTIRCGSRFEVLPRGRVLADVQAPTLVVHEGASMNGKMRMGAAETSPIADQPTPTVVQRRAARNRA